jgi:quaternary ammonium compound-resistance protein SugE
MAWVILIASGVLESVWASALGASDNFRRPKATALFAVSLVASMAGLALAMNEIPVGTAYAVWAGTGAALTVTYAMLTGQEAVTVLRVLFLVGIVGSVVGLKLLKAPAPRPVPTADVAGPSTSHG